MNKQTFLTPQPQSPLTNAITCLGFVVVGAYQENPDVRVRYFSSAVPYGARALGGALTMMITRIDPLAPPPEPSGW